MFCNCEPNFVEKFLWESDFSNFGHVTIFAKQKIRFLAAILKPYRVLNFFCWNMVIIIVCIYGVKKNKIPVGKWFTPY